MQNGIAITELPEDVLLEITSHVPPLSLIRFLSLSKKLWNLRHRIQNQNEPFLSVIQRYRECVLQNDWITAIHISITRQCLESTEFFVRQYGINNMNDFLGQAAQQGDMNLIRLFISKGANDWNKGLKKAALGGHKDIVNFFISKGAKEWSNAMIKAAQGGFREIVDMMISHGANDWRNGMLHSALGGHEDLVKFFASKGVECWDVGLTYAAMSSNVKVLQYFIEKGATSVNRALQISSCREVAKFLVERGANDFGPALVFAASRHRLDVINYLLEAKPDIEVKFLNQALGTAAENGNMELVTFFVQRGANDLNDALRHAAKCGSDNKAIVEYLIELGANDWNGAMHNAIEFPHHRYLIDYFIEKGADDFKGAKTRTYDALNYYAATDSAIVQHLTELQNFFGQLCKKPRTQ